MIRIVTDSTCEAPAALLAHPRVTVVPLTVIFGQQALLDGVEITREQFWARLPKSEKLPTTSQASPAQFEAPFRALTDAGDEVIALVISARLSQTYNSALIARDALEGRPIDIVDSQSTSIGLGLMLQEAVALAEAGASREEVVARLTQMRPKVRLTFVLETLEYLEKGGRIGKAQAFVGTLLKFKPLLGIVDGEVVPVTRVRSRAKALEAVQELLLTQVPARGEHVRIGMTHALAAAEAQQVGAKLAAQFGAPAPFLADLGPVLGVHVGPGTIGVAVYSGD
jgi:DegV family protein with EDD domain